MMQDKVGEFAAGFRRWLWRQFVYWGLPAFLFVASAWVFASWYHVTFDHFLPMIEDWHDFNDDDDGG